MDYCLACFGLYNDTDSDDTEPLIPRGPRRRTDPLPAESRGDKFVDILVALNSGKLPSQEQLNRIFRYVLKSDLLRDETVQKVVAGKGPMSRAGRKVIGDVKDVVQSMLELGMEKNDDNKIQSIIHQLSQIEDIPIRVDIDASPALGAGQSAVNIAEAGASKLREEAPTQGEVVSDTQILLSCIKTLLRTTLTSSVFRVLITDTLDIARSLVVRAAVDVESAADVVKEAAEEVEKTARDENVGTSLEGIKKKGKEVAGSAVDGGRKVREEWEGATDELERGAKRKLVMRIQGMITRAQRDPASRQALHAILLLVRKYSSIISKMSQKLAESASSAAEKPNYPPVPYPPTSPSPPTIDVDIISSELDSALGDLKIFVERLAKGKSIDPLWDAFKQVVLDMAEMPAEVVETVEEKAQEKMDEVDSQEQTAGGKEEVLQAQPPGGCGGGKKKRKGKSKTPQAKSPAPPPKQPEEPSAWGNKILGSEIILTPSGASASEAQSAPKTETPAPFNEDEFPPLPSQKEPSESDKSERGNINPYIAYFSDINTYLERALSEPEWAASDKGTHLLELLVEMGAELMSFTGEAVGEALGEVTSEEGKKMECEDHTLKQRFGQDMQTLLNEFDKLSTAIESDRTTMHFLRSIQRLGSDFADLLSEAPAQGKKKAKAAAARSGLLGFGTTWAQWLSWGLPKILSMIPSDWIPISTVEVKSPSVDGSLDALWLNDSGTWSGDSEAGVKGSLIPDQFVLRNWTEVQVDMPTDSDSERAVRTSSRIQIHMDGIRAAIRGLGYYFRYKGSVFDYEDEGVLSVNLGTNKAKRGVGLDIELEVDSSTETLENIWHPDRVIPQIVVESESTNEDDGSPNIDVQRTVTSSTAALGEGGTRQVPVSQTSLGPALQEPVEPLFRVTDIKLDLDGLNIHLDQSKHWILNKILMQPIGTPAIAHIMRTAVEEQIRNTLGWFAVGMGRLLVETRERRRKRRIAERDSVRQREPFWDLEEIEDEIEDETMSDMITDWWGALIEKGPEAFGYDKETEEDEDEDVETFTNLQATSKGIIYSSVTTTQQPSLGPIMNPVVSPEEMEPFDLNQNGFASQQPSSAFDSRPQREEETVVAIGTGSQLFPGKGGPYGQTNDEGPSQQGLVDRVGEAVTAGAERIKNGLDGTKSRIQRSTQELERAKQRKDTRKRIELSRDGWQSPVFDLVWVR